MDILTKPKNALTKQYQKLFEMDGVKLRFDEKALRAVAQQAMQRDSGARGLRAILEKAMLDIMFEVPSEPSIKEVVIKDNVIRKGEKPLTVYEKKEAEPA